MQSIARTQDVSKKSLMSEPAKLMMPSENIVQILLSDGFSFVCANCEHMWWATEDIKRYKTRICKEGVLGNSCSGPLLNMAFPLYQGPLKSVLSKFCFRCGTESDLVVIVPGGKVGVCQEHVEILRMFSLPGIPPPILLKRKIDLKDNKGV